MIIQNSFYFLYFKKEEKLRVMLRISVLLWSVNFGIVTRYKLVISGFYTVFQYLQVFKPIIHFVCRGFGMSYLPPYIPRGEIMLDCNCKKSEDEDTSIVYIVFSNKTQILNRNQD